MDAMVGYLWPGNIRELYNLIENAVIISDTKVIGMKSVPLGFFERRMDDDDEPAVETNGSRKKFTQGSSEKERIKAALESNRYVISDCAKSLGISRTTLWRKMKTLDIK